MRDFRRFDPLGSDRDELDPLPLRSVLRVSTAVWSLIALLMVLNVIASSFIERGTFPSWRAIVPAIVEWYLWVPLTPVVLWLGRRFPVDGDAGWTRFLPHLGGIVGATILRGIVYTTTTVLIAGTPLSAPLPTFLVRIIVGFLPIAAIMYVAILAAGSTLEYSQRLRRGEVRSARLEGQLAQAELRALRANLQPHFLFNTLHSVGALVRERETDAAVGVIAELSDLLRRLLQRDAPEEVRLQDELEFARRYLAIEQVRFADRLHVEWDIEPTTMCAKVPRLLLQPLVENAIRHGVARSTAAGHVAVTSRRTADWLEITVQDDGPGPPPEAVQVSDTGGIGLASTRARLQHAYGSSAGVQLMRAPHGGAIATARLPFRTVESIDTDDLHV